MDVKILGTGCANCRRLESNTRDALRQLGVDAHLEKVEDIADIMEYAITRTPGLVVDGRLVAYGRVPGVQEIVAMLSDVSQASKHH